MEAKIIQPKKLNLSHMHSSEPAYRMHANMNQSSTTSEKIRIHSLLLKIQCDSD